MNREPAIGDLVVYRTLSGVGVARVDIVRERDVTTFPWRQADRRWDRRRAKIDRRDVLAKLPRNADFAAIADQFNALTNRRAAERLKANRQFNDRVDELLAEIGIEA